MMSDVCFFYLECLCFFVKQKTAYEMRISDCSSDVCSSDLDEGRSREDILTELRSLAASEDEAWETGKCSGSMYCGDHDHYGFMNEVFGLFGHMNILQRDMCPSATRFEGEVIAMALDLMHGDAAADRGHDIAGMVTSGGAGSIMHALLAYRDHARQERGITNPNIVKPETSHPAFDKGCHLFGIEARNVPVDPDTTTVRPEVVAGQIDENTVAIVGSACNYGYGTIDPIPELSELAVERGVGLHVDGCLGGRSEEHTSELQSLMRNSYSVFCLKKKTNQHYTYTNN